LDRDDDAQELYRRAIDLFSQVDHGKNLSVLFRDYAKLLKAAERYEEAIVQFRAAAKEYERNGKPLDAAWMQDWIAGCYRDAGKDEQAATVYQAALDVFTKAGDQEGIAEEGYDLGQALVRLKRHADAIAPLTAAADANEKIDQPRTAAEIRLLLADAHLQLKQPEPGVKQYDQAIALYAKAELPRRAADAAEQAGRELLKSGRKADARRFLLKAQRAYEELNESAKAAELEREIFALDSN
jgi:tetratricopeptide (TPR) repeat protein